MHVEELHHRDLPENTVSMSRLTATWKQRAVDGQYCRDDSMALLTFIVRGKNTKW